MSAKNLSLSVLLIGAFLLEACGTPATPTQPPTAIAPAETPIPSATLMPYDLTVTVTDTNGNPIGGASVVFPESGDSAAVTVDEAGQFTWRDLNGPNVSLTVTAQGYFKGQQGALLERGPNEVIVNLERDPFGLLPSDACAPGETLLYTEDFQDGAVENWGVYPPGTTIPIEADPTAADNKALLLNFGNTDGEFDVNTIPLRDNVVVRFKYMPGDHSRFHAGIGNSYSIRLSADEISLLYYSDATGEQNLAHGKPVMTQGVWHVLEFSSYNGRIEVWADAKLAASYDGATTLTQGPIFGIGSAYLPPESIVRIDDVSICGLNAPFAPMPATAP